MPFYTASRLWSLSKKTWRWPVSDVITHVYGGDAMNLYKITFRDEEGTETTSYYAVGKSYSQAFYALERVLDLEAYMEAFNSFDFELIEEDVAVAK
jgi:hypothetical protein